MYEPVSDRCVTSTIINPRYSSNRAGNFDRTCNPTSPGAECGSLTGCGDCASRDLIPPEKPPRKCKLHQLREGKCRISRTFDQHHYTKFVTHLLLDTVKVRRLFTQLIIVPIPRRIDCLSLACGIIVSTCQREVVAHNVPKYRQNAES